MDHVEFKVQLTALFHKARRLQGSYDWTVPWQELSEELLKDHKRPGRDTWANASFEEIPAEMRPVLVRAFALAFT